MAVRRRRALIAVVTSLALVSFAPLLLAPEAAGEGVDDWVVVYRYPRENSALSGIDARASRDVWAVGGEGPFDRARVVTVRWDGRRWHPTRSWQPSSGYASLYDVRAIGPDLAWAVGRVRNGTLVLRWNGVRWERVRLPHAITASAELRGLDDIEDLRALWAVGRSRGEALILRWNGSRWRRMNTPDLPNSILFDVVSVSRTNALAVGQAGGSSLIMRWHRGDGWRVLDDPVYVDGRFEGVAVSRGRVVVVGYRDGPLLVERVDDGWREVAWTWPGETFFLRDVDGFRGEFWVVGDRYRQDGRIRPFVLRGREGRWRDVRVPAPGPFSGLDAVSVSATWVWATGHDGEGESITGLVMRGGVSP